MSVSGLSNQTITLKQAGVMNEYGEYTYTTSSIQARVTLKKKVLVNKIGEEVTSYAYAITPTEVKYGDKLVLEDGMERQVINVNNVPNRQGIFHHSEIYV